MPNGELNFAEVAATVAREFPVDGDVVDAEYQGDGMEVLVNDTLNLPAAKAKIEMYAIEAGRILADANAIEVADEETQRFAVALGGECKKVVKALDLKRRAITADAEEFVKSVKGIEKNITGPLSKAEEILKQKLSVYRTRQEIARRKAEQDAKAAADALQKKLDAEAKEKGVESVKVDAPVIPKQEKVVRSETGTASYTVKSWRLVEISDPKAVPREFCEPATKLINEAIRMGVREIPGCRIEEVSETRFRT